MASNLHDKINSYSIERGVEFSETYALPPTRTGSLSQSTDSSWSLLGNAPTYQSNVGPIGGAGSWKFTNNVGTATACRIQAPGLASRHNDEDYSSGIWVKFNQLPTGSGSADVVFHLVPNPTNNIGYGFGLSGSSHPTDPSKLSIQAETSPKFASSITINTTDWYYVAIRRVDNEVKWYVNGSLIHTLTVTGTGTASNVNFGNATTNSIQDFNISNYYVATSSVITETQIAEIWTAGSTLPASVNYSADPMTASNAVFVDPIISGQAIISKTPATASALMTEPTIIITSNDYTKITTSIIVSAEFLPNFAVYASQNINFIVTEVLDISAELMDNVIVSTATDDSFSATEFIASAEMLPAKVAEAPMEASAIMLNGVASVTPSYYKLIKDSNPLFYTNLDSSTITNFGSWTGVTYSVGSTVTKNVPSTNKMALIGEGKSWRFSGSTSANNNFVRIIPQNAETTIRDLVLSKNYTLEAWTKINNEITGSYSGFQIKFGNIDFKIDRSNDIQNFTNSNNPGIDLYVNSLVYGFNGKYGGFDGTIPLSSTEYFLFESDVSLIKANDWNHIVIRVSENNVSVYINGSYWNGFSKAIDTTAVTNASVNWDEIVIYDGFDTNDGGAYIDEIAFYDFALTQSTIIDHFSFINNKSPDSTIYATPCYATISEQSHQFVVISNTNVPAAAITASALFVNPVVLAVKSINVSATTLTASATNTDVTVYWGWTIYPAAAIAFAEMGPTYFLSSYYYQYIQNNFAPYRYVTFDSSAPYLDYGSDTDYSVANVVVNGTVVNPDFGINGKSVKSTGTYTNGAAILKESEHDDTWGTGNNSWHSAFWMRRALDDTSTGLRVLWNVNGYADNQYIIIYHYENKLHVQINSQNDSPITISSTNNVNIFDFERHHIVLNSHHNNNNNILTLYVDGVQVATQNIGTYAITTINGTPHVGPNDEANNLPRLGIGTLITPFGFTALPVVPSNISVYFDEIYWDKNQITLTEVVNQYNAMPDQTNENVLAEPFITNAELFMPAISTQVILSTAPATGSTEFVNPTLYIERFVVTAADLMEASALMTEAVAFVPVQVNADVMIATGIFDSPGIIIAIPGQTMYATALLKSEDLILSTTTRFGTTVVTNTFRPYTMMSPWLAYLRATDANSILPLREVK